MDKTFVCVGFSRNHENAFLIQLYKMRRFYGRMGKEAAHKSAMVDLETVFHKCMICFAKSKA